MIKYTIISLVLLLIPIALSADNNKLLIYVTNQNQFLTEKINHHYLDRLNNDFITLSGFTIIATRNMEFDKFIKATRKDLERTYKEKKPPIGYHYTGKIMLDIEHPVHLTQTYKLKKSSLIKYIKAINLRVSVIRSFHPKAEIGLYGVYAPAHSCRFTKDDNRRLRSLTANIKSGILQGIDFVSVVSYMRYKPSTVGNDINVCLAKKSIQGLDKLANKIPSSIKIIPLLSLRIYNKKSEHNREFVLYDKPNLLFGSLLHQVRCFENLGIKEVAVWHPNEKTIPAKFPKWQATKLLIKLFNNKNKYIDKKTCLPISDPIRLSH